MREEKASTLDVWKKRFERFELIARTRSALEHSFGRLKKIFVRFELISWNRSIGEKIKTGFNLLNEFFAAEIETRFEPTQESFAVTIESTKCSGPIRIFCIITLSSLTLPDSSPDQRRSHLICHPRLVKCRISLNAFLEKEIFIKYFQSIKRTVSSCSRFIDLQTSKAKLIIVFV